MNDEKKTTDDPKSGQRHPEKLSDEELRDVLSVLREDPDIYRERMDRVWQKLRKHLDDPKL